MGLVYFQKRNKNPTLRHAKMCVPNKRKPVMVSPSRLIPTVPIIKRGPELLVKARSRSASSFVTMPCIRKSVTIFAPTGVPLMIPIKRAKLPCPGTWKIGRINPFNNLPKIGIMLV